MQRGDVVDGRFRLEERIGAGGMGVVFRALDLRTDRAVAIKIVASTEDAADVARARREAQLLAQLAHPAIVTHVADGLVPDGRLFLAMEWIDGITAGERIANDGFTLAESVALLGHVAAALAAAHAAGIVHRDIKPSNVLLANAALDVVKLIDFGVARLAAGRGLTRTGTAVGTPGYMAPEQARGDRTLTAAVDVFGLGSLFYECATGRPAFSGSQRAAVLAKVLFTDPQPLAEHCPDAPAALVELVERMLAKEPARRLPDGGAVVAALAAVGPIAPGVRHVGGRLVDATVRIAPSHHCVVLAAYGHPDEPSRPIEPSEELVRVTTECGARLAALDTGALAAHLSGNPAEIANRAAHCALAIRSVLPACAIAISAIEVDAAAAADGGAALLTETAMAAIIGGARPEIVVDPRTAALLRDELVIEAGVLRGKKPR